MQKNEGLVYDLMELFRAKCDYAVLETLEILKKNKVKGYTVNSRYEIRLTKDTILILIERLKLVLSLYEIILNTRILARYLLTNKGLTFNVKPIEVHRNDTLQVKDIILSKSFRQLGINKSTLWYQKRRLEQTGSIRIYNKTTMRVINSFSYFDYRCFLFIRMFEYL